MSNLTLPQGEIGMTKFHSVKGFIFDMDGTLILGDKSNHGFKALPGAIELLDWLAEEGVPYVVFTNGTTRSPTHYANTLRELGFNVSEEQMLTPIKSALVAFADHGHKRILTLGGEALAEPLRQNGFVPLTASDLHDQGSYQVDAVLTGWYPEFTMSDLEAACLAIESGAKLYSSSDAIYFASSKGRALGTSRAMCAMIREVTGCSVHVVGKPSNEALSCAAKTMGVEVHDLAVVGDDPLLEVQMAHVGKACAIGVNTGLGNASSYEDLPVSAQPHLLLSGVDQLLKICREEK